MRRLAPTGRGAAKSGVSQGRSFHFDADTISGIMVTMPWSVETLNATVVKKTEKTPPGEIDVALERPRN